jgi:phosphoglycolate phosphatase
MPEPAALHWVLLDLDDTLVDTRDACYRACQISAQELALPVPTDEGFHRVYGRLEFSECVGAWCGAGHFAEFSRVYLRNVRYGAIGDVAGLLQRVRRMRLRVGLITNSSPAQVQRKLNDLRIPVDRFDCVMTPADLPAGKPDVSAFTGVLDRYGIEPGRAVYVSDHPADGCGARAAGMTFRGVLTGVWTVADFRASRTADEHVFDTVHDALRPVLTRTPRPPLPVQHDRGPRREVRNGGVGHVVLRLGRSRLRQDKVIWSPRITVSRRVLRPKPAAPFGCA